MTNIGSISKHKKVEVDIEMRALSTVFLAQSYADTWNDYQRSLIQENFKRWDYVVLTAANEHQAEAFRCQIRKRQEQNLLPNATRFVIVSDPDGKRIGSGGATLNVLRHIAEDQEERKFSNLCIMVIHSGGDSKRVPQYSAIGKLFSPVPHELPNGQISTLFDEILISMSSVPARLRKGMLLLSGDVLLLFNPLQIDYSGDGAAAISFEEHVNIGKEHGVFLRGQNGYVRKFLHKQSTESLKNQGAVKENGAVDIDTGAVIFSTDMLNSLYSLISENGRFCQKKFNRYVNDTVRLSLYGDFLYPLASDATLEDFYKEKPEGEYCDELMEARTEIWNVLHPYRMKLLRLAPAKFIHFGTTKEILQLMSSDIDQYNYLGWSRHVNSSIASSAVAGYGSVLSKKAKYGKDCYLEVSYIHKDAAIGDNVLLSYVDIHNEAIPSNVVLHGLKQFDGRFVVRIFGIDDNPKDTLEAGGLFLAKPISKFMERCDISAKELWQGKDHPLWEANLFPVCDNIRDAVAAALNLYEIAHGRGDVALWKNAQRKSFETSFAQADTEAIISWDKRMQELVRMDRLSKLIFEKKPVREAAATLQTKELTPIQEKWLNERLLNADYNEAMRLHYYVGCALGGLNGERHIAECFRCIREAVLRGTLSELRFNDRCRIIADRHTVKLPLRVNWGGGWSDTPPHCNENGGTVLNASILLNNKMPVEVTMARLAEFKIVFDSRDMDVHGEFDAIEELQNTGDPYDPFALPKAALLACGIIPVEGGSLMEILRRLGGGLYIQTEVTGVPKGSGLGTSSILSAACVKAIYEFMGIEYRESDLYGHVLAMEQIMSTGGGWQDQVGGLSSGINYITTMPGLKQQINVRRIVMPESARRELNERFCLIYTGQRRLARNLLRDVVGRYIGNEPDSLYALNEIQRIAALMRFELERGNIDAFAELLNEHWELSKKIDSGSTNTLIEQIFESIADMIDGRMICGAGGGGFLQVILKRHVAKEDIHRRLKSVFQDNDIDMWNSTLLE